MAAKDPPKKPEPSPEAIQAAVKPILESLRLHDTPFNSHTDLDVEHSNGTEANRSCFPARISSGSDRTVWSLGPRLVLRALPASGRPDGYAEASLRRDAEVSRLLRRYLRRPEVVPKVFTSVEVDGWVGNIEKGVRGVSLEDAEPTAKTVEDLANFLIDIAAIPIEEARKAVDGYQTDRSNMKKRVTKSIRSWNAMMADGYISDPGRCLEAVLKDQLKLLSVQVDSKDYKPVLLHADIYTEHIYIDPNTGALEGVIDWSDAQIGDPCIDIAGLATAVEEEMTRKICSMAGYSRYTAEKGILYAMYDIVGQQREWIRECNGVPDEKKIKEFRDACEYLELDKVTLNLQRFEAR